MAALQPLLSDAFSQVVKRRRERRGLSRARLAEMAGLSQPYIGLLERAERSPNLDTADAIASALGVPLVVLIAEAQRLAPRPPSRPTKMSGAFIGAVAEAPAEKRKPRQGQQCG
jgi:transcriptional regulator with XRE-family HTH domain